MLKCKQYKKQGDYFEEVEEQLTRVHFCVVCVGCVLCV